MSNQQSLALQLAAAIEKFGTETLAETLCEASAELRRLDAVEKQRDQLLTALQEMVELSEEPPEENCSCHLHPPCNDCVDHSGLRYAFEQSRAAITKVKGGAV